MNVSQMDNLSKTNLYIYLAIREKAIRILEKIKYIDKSNILKKNISHELDSIQFQLQSISYLYCIFCRDAVNNCLKTNNLKYIIDNLYINYVKPYKSLPLEQIFKEIKLCSSVSYSSETSQVSLCNTCQTILDNKSNIKKLIDSNLDKNIIQKFIKILDNTYKQYAITLLIKHMFKKTYETIPKY